MSTVPPPPPPASYPGPIPGAPPLSARAQRRMQAAQARWHRDQIRLQMRAARRRSIVGPMLLVAVGTMLLLLQSGRVQWPDALVWLGRWWPAILIGSGLVMVGEWSIDRQHVPTNTGVFTPRRTLGGGAAWLLALIALSGSGIMIAHNGSAWAQRNFGADFADRAWNGWQHVLGGRREFDQTLAAPLSATGTLLIENPRGDVTVTGSSPDGQVHVNVQQHIYSWQQNDFDRRRQTEAPRFQGSREVLQLTSVSQDQDDADLVIELPREAALRIVSGHGDVTLSEMRGSIEVHAFDGDVKLTALTGPVHLRTDDDGATVTAHSLGSGLVFEGRSGDISITDVQGPTTLHGDFFGTTQLKQLRGAVAFQSSFTNFSCASLPGELNIEGRSDLDGKGLDGPCSIVTTDRNLTLAAVRGGLNVQDRNGSVEVSLANTVQPVTITNADGSIQVALPPQASATVQAKTQNGDIENDFGLTSQKTGDTSQLSTRLGAGGPLLHLETTEGDIHLERADPARSQDWDEADDHVTLTPAPHVRPAHKHSIPPPAAPKPPQPPTAP